MAARPSLLAHGEEAVHRPRHRTAHEQQVPLGIHLHHAQAQLREVAGAHMTGHALSLDDARRVRPRSDRAGLAVPSVAVGLRAAAEVMAVHYALEAAALGHTRDLHAVARGEDRHPHALALLRRLARCGAPEALQ